MKLPKKLQNKLEKRSENNSLRSLQPQNKLIDFSSNDYLGFSKSTAIYNRAHQFLKDNNLLRNGASGSRLISGNHFVYQKTEKLICKTHQTEAAVIFNSGYDANVGFFSSVCQRGDLILFDEYIHASIRDGIQMSLATAFKFKHNNLEELEMLLERHSETYLAKQQTIYVVTESVFSMDGDSPELPKMAKIIEHYNAHFVVDEAHAIGVLGTHNLGLISHEKVFARIVTYGKAMGCHGAAILCSNALKEYLVNFARSFIYTTGLPPHSVATIYESYKELDGSNSSKKLQENISFFKEEVGKNALENIFIFSNSAIQSCVITGNEKVKRIAKNLQEKGFDVKPILSPTVPEGQERIRFCLHAYNSFKEITDVLETLRIFVSSNSN